MSRFLAACVVLSLMLAPVASAQAAPFFPFTFSTGDPDGKIATASRPSSPGLIEIESADDFVVPGTTVLNHATFTGLLPSGTSVSNIGSVTVELYRVFPKDSDTTRTIQVPTRVNSPSDVAFDTRSTSSSDLTFSVSTLASNFTAANSVVNGIHPKPNQFTGGEGQVSGQEVKFDVTFSHPFVLPADHYFFVPQVGLTSPTGNFLWLSAPRPIVPPGTPFPPGTTDLQSWIRNDNLAPDWLRIGTDIVGNTTFNATFSLDGTVVPEPSSLAVWLVGIACVVGWQARRRTR